LQDTDAVFKPLLDVELRKISSFYTLQEKQFLQELIELEELVKEQDDIGMLDSRFFGDGQWDEDEDEDEDDWPSTERSRDHPPSKRRRRASTSAGRAISQGGGWNVCCGYYDTTSVGLDCAKMTSTCAADVHHGHRWPSRSLQMRLRSVGIA
jgi:hypothetical protein